MSGPGGQIDRRSFFKVIATSGAVAAASACSRPASELLSLVTPPEEIIPGVATYFATTCRECPSGLRRAREEPRRPRHQARGQSGLSGDGWGALHRRASGSPGPVPSRSLSRGARRGQAPCLGRGREASGRQGRRPREGRPGAEDRAGERARIGNPRPSHGRLGSRLRRAAAGGVRGDRVRVPARGESRRVRTRRHSALRHRRGGLSAVLRRRFPARRGSARSAIPSASPRCTASSMAEPARRCTSSRGCP